MALTYRKMTIGDLPAVFSLRTSTIENAITLEELKEDYGVTPETAREAMKSHVAGWLCEDSGAVVGFSMGNRSNGEVLVLAVHPEYEGRAIGKTLLNEVASWLFSVGHKEIWLAANPDSSIRAYGFYRHLGWQTNGKMADSDEIMVLRDIN